LAQLWWQNIGDASSGAKTPQEALTALAVAQERLMQRLERADVLGECGPRLNEPQSREYWLSQPGAPKPKLANEKPQGITIDYDELVSSWQ
jgi:glycerol transport system substrate-binding protein